MVKFHGHAFSADEAARGERARAGGTIVLTREEYDTFFHRHPAKALLLEGRHGGQRMRGGVITMLGNRQERLRRATFSARLKRTSDPVNQQRESVLPFRAC